MKRMIIVLLALLLSLTLHAQESDDSNREMVGYIAYTNDNPNCHPIPCPADIIVIEPNSFTFEVYDVIPSGRILSWSPDFRRIIEEAEFSDVLFSVTMPSGNRNVLFESPDNIEGATWSPTGNRIALTNRALYSSGEDSFFLLDAYGFGFYKITLDFSPIGNPIWHPSGNTVLIQGQLDDRQGIWQIDIETQVLTRILDEFQNINMPEYSKNGEMMTFFASVTDRRYEIYLLDVNSGEVRQVTGVAPHFYDFTGIWNVATPFVFDDSHIIYQVRILDSGNVLRVHDLNTDEVMDITKATTDYGYDIYIENFAVAPSGDKVAYFTLYGGHFCIIDLTLFEERCEILYIDSGYVPYSRTRLSWGR